MITLPSPIPGPVLLQAALNAGFRDTNREARYTAVLTLVNGLEPVPASSRLAVHWRNADGELLTTLDEVVRAALDGELVPGNLPTLV